MILDCILPFTNEMFSHLSSFCGLVNPRKLNSSVACKVVTIGNDLSSSRMAT